MHSSNWKSALCGCFSSIRQPHKTYVKSASLRVSVVFLLLATGQSYYAAMGIWIRLSEPHRVSGGGTPYSPSPHYRPEDSSRARFFQRNLRRDLCGRDFAGSVQSAGECATLCRKAERSRYGCGNELPMCNYLWQTMGMVWRRIMWHAYSNRSSLRKKTEARGWAWLFRRRSSSVTLGASPLEAAPFLVETAQLSELLCRQSAKSKPLRPSFDRGPTDIYDWKE